MGWTSSCFEIAAKDMYDARAALKQIEKEYSKLKWWQILKICRMQQEWGNANERLIKAEIEYYRLFT